MFEKIKKFYNFGLWTEKMVYEAMIKNIISIEEYNEILGEKNEY